MSGVRGQGRTRRTPRHPRLDPSSTQHGAAGGAPARSLPAACCKAQHCQPPALPCPAPTRLPTMLLTRLRCLPPQHDLDFKQDKKFKSYLKKLGTEHTRETGQWVQERKNHCPHTGNWHPLQNQAKSSEYC